MSSFTVVYDSEAQVPGVHVMALIRSEVAGYYEASEQWEDWGTKLDTPGYKHFWYEGVDAFERAMLECEVASTTVLVVPGEGDSEVVWV